MGSILTAERTAGSGGGGDGGGGAAFSTPDRTRYDAVAANTYNIAADATRRYAVVVNQSAVNLFVSLGATVDVTPGAEDATIVLPGNAAAGYEVLEYTGPITIKFDDDDADGYALVTLGTP